MPNYADLARRALRSVGLMAEQAPEQPQMWIHEFSDAEKSALARRWADKKKVRDMLMRPRTQLDDTLGDTFKGVERRKSMKEKLMERPTTGLVTNVLGDPAYHRGHAKFTGKSY